MNEAGNVKSETLQEAISGNEQQVYNILVKKYHIKPEKPIKVSADKPVYFQLTPLRKQIQEICKAVNRSGEVYYTEEFGGVGNIPYTFKILHVKIQITK